MSRDHYPNDIHLVKPLDVATPKQQRAVEILQNHWGESLKELGKREENISRSTLERTRDAFFGPDGYPITFGEIKEIDEFDGRVSQWMRAELNGRIDDDGRPIRDDESLTADEREEIYQEGFTDGRIQGNQEGWMRYDNALLENLDPETYRKVRNAIGSLEETRN